MNTQDKRPRAWYYDLGALIFMLGCLVAAVIFAFSAGELPAAIAGTYDLDGLTQVVVPGSADLALSRTGAYAIYYEHKTTVDGVAYVSGETPPNLDCSLVRRATSQDIPLVPDLVATNGYTSRDWGRQGKLIMSTTVSEPGLYTFSCQYPDGRDQPQYVLAVGQNRHWELLRALTGAAGSIAGSLAVLVVAAIVALIVVLVVTIKRGRRL